MILRCTSRVTQTLKLGRLADALQGRDDWYVNIVTIARRRVVLAVHADTYFPVVAVGVSHLRAAGSAWLARHLGGTLAAIEGATLRELQSRLGHASCGRL